MIKKIGYYLNITNYYKISEASICVEQIMLLNKRYFE